jgi:hypothetical protein
MRPVVLLHLAAFFDFLSHARHRHTCRSGGDGQLSLVTSALRSPAKHRHCNRLADATLKNAGLKKRNRPERVGKILTRLVIGSVPQQISCLGGTSSTDFASHVFGFPFGSGVNRFAAPLETVNLLTPFCKTSSGAAPPRFTT